jgi:hypothetical protein
VGLSIRSGHGGILGIHYSSSPAIAPSQGVKGIYSSANGCLAMASNPGWPPLSVIPELQMVVRLR